MLGGNFPKSSGVAGQAAEQHPAAADHGGDLGAGEQPPGCFPGSQARAPGVSEQRPAAVRAATPIPGELVQDQCAALLPDPGGCCDIGAGFRAAATACRAMPGWTGGWPSKRIRSTAASQMTQARCRLTGPQVQDTNRGTPPARRIRLTSPESDDVRCLALKAGLGARDGAA
jgi:hypothetical protein